MAFSVTLVVALSEPTRIDPVSIVGVGLLTGVGMWLILVSVPLAVVFGRKILLLNLASLAALMVSGVWVSTVSFVERSARV